MLRIHKSDGKRYRVECNLRDGKNFPLTLKLLKIILSRIVSKTCTGPILGVVIEVNLKIKQKKNPPPTPRPHEGLENIFSHILSLTCTELISLN